ncbi:MAG: adenylate cyclase [Planctomycetota bacterium]|jgi:adenylate cyclase
MRILTSKQLIELAGISRATLNNYISLGILKKPTVQPAQNNNTRAPRIGYFPESDLRRIQKVQQLKKQGVPMSDVAEEMKNTEMDDFLLDEDDHIDLDLDPALLEEQTDQIDQNMEQSAHDHIARERSNIVTQQPLPAKLENLSIDMSLDNLPGPSYMVNNNFELVWWNEQAFEDLFRLDAPLEGDIESRNLLKLLINNKNIRSMTNWMEMISIHVGAAKRRIPSSSMSNAYSSINSEDIKLIDDLYTSGDVSDKKHISHFHIDIYDKSAGMILPHDLYISYFREGIMFAYSPENSGDDSILDFLSRRSHVIRDLLRKRKPFLTDLAVIVADLQDSCQICAELPPEEYFQLINHIWQSSEPIFRKYYGTHGKHVGDGMVYYFFPQPDSSYIKNAIDCALELKKMMQDVTREWQARKNWLHDLHLNTGLNEGQEWFGTYYSDTNLEFTVLGDTINHAARISDLARYSSILATKGMIGKLTPDERASFRFGIRQETAKGDEIFVSDLYSRVSSLVDLKDNKNIKFNDIATIPVTEIIDARGEHLYRRSRR